MSLASDFMELDEGVQLVLLVGAAFVAYNLYLSFTNPNGSNPLAPDPTDTTGNPNSVGDTSQSAYAGNGLLGAFGNFFNQALGGIPQSLGNAIGGALAPSASESN